MPQPATRIDDITIDELIADPYPAFDRIRASGSAVWVDCARIHLVTRFDDIVTVERNHQIFASTNPGSLMNQVMGHSLMRKDDAEHKLERAAVEPSFMPDVVQNHWRPIFQGISSDLIADFEADGTVDLFGAFAAPMASYALIEMLGFENVAWEDIAWWSQALMDGVGNYQGDPEIAKRGKQAADGIANAIDQVLDKHRSERNPSILSSMAHADHEHSLDQIRANVNVIVGGGLNEPRDAILTTTMALLQNPDQRAEVEAEPILFSKAFEEAVRWVSPIGMYPRRVTEDAILGDTLVKAGDQLGICVSAANRDKTKFDAPDAFNINRPRARHLGFGAGPHFCAGTSVARQMCGHVAVPMLFERLSGLRLIDTQPPQEKGWVFRGPVTLPVAWEI